VTDITMHFFNDGPYPACLEYSYIPSGKRRSLQLSQGQHAITRVDQLEPEEIYSLVQVYSVQTEQSGASWNCFPSTGARNSPLVVVIFRLHHANREVVATAYYEDGTDYSETSELVPTSIECPSGL